ncbi:YraN family protein [Rhodobacteraceae bacterium]|nr:YraN family protein [Paracoccaceae bacterium]
MPSGFSPSDTRALQGATSYHDGLAAEDAVERHYLHQGYTLAERRWRGQGGEIDLILRDGRGFVFVEVKKARTHARAAERLSSRQLQRICASGEDYCGQKAPGRFVDMRIDLATVDATGQINVLPNISQY